MVSFFFFFFFYDVFRIFDSSHVRSSSGCYPSATYPEGEYNWSEVSVYTQICHFIVTWQKSDSLLQGSFLHFCLVAFFLPWVKNKQTRPVTPPATPMSSTSSDRSQKSSTVTPRYWGVSTLCFVCDRMITWIFLNSTYTLTQYFDLFKL